MKLPGTADAAWKPVPATIAHEFGYETVLLEEWY